MKRVKLIKILIACVITCFSLHASGQQPMQGNVAKPDSVSPEKMSKHITDEMQSVVALSADQYKKIYKLNLKELKSTQSKSFSMGGPGGPGGMPPMGGGPGGFGGGMPGDDSQESEEDKQAEQKKQMEKKDKKLKKILSADQFKMWKDYEAKKRENAPTPDPKNNDTK